MLTHEQVIESQSREIAALKEQEAQLCTLYGRADAECKRLRKDAERYAWLRDNWFTMDSSYNRAPSHPRHRMQNHVCGRGQPVGAGHVTLHI